MVYLSCCFPTNLTIYQDGLGIAEEAPKRSTWNRFAETDEGLPFPIPVVGQKSPAEYPDMRQCMLPTIDQILSTNTQVHVKKTKKSMIFCLFHGHVTVCLPVCLIKSTVVKSILYSQIQCNLSIVYIYHRIAQTISEYPQYPYNLHISDLVHYLI